MSCFVNTLENKERFQNVNGEKKGVPECFLDKHMLAKNIHITFCVQKMLNAVQ